MSITFTKATRSNVHLLIGLAGGTGSGKTKSAMRLATGLSGGKPFGLIDTENGRALHYADEFQFDHAPLGPPFTADRYGEALKAAASAYDVVVVDSFSHEYAGEGGLLDQQEAELQRMAGDDAKRREAVKMASWIKPKMRHKRLVSQLLQLPCHLILCLRAESKVDIVKEGGKTVIKPKQSLTGLDGWIPVCEKNLPFELTISLLFSAERPGYPRPIKLEDQHRLLLPLDHPVSEEVGADLAKWASGDGGKRSAVDKRVVELVQQINDCADKLGNRDVVSAAIAKNRRAHAGDPAKHVEWLEATVAAALAKVAEAKAGADDDPFAASQAAPEEIPA